MILVTTAGNVGAETVRLLAGRGEPVRVLVRSLASHAALVQAGAEVTVGDLADSAAIERALRGGSSVVLVTPGLPAQELAVIDAAADSGVEHIVKITSDASADSPIERRRDHARVEAGLTASGLPHTLLRCNAYMQNMLMLAPVIAATGGFGSVAGDGQIGMIDSRDVAAVAAKIAASPDGHAGNTYRLSGPQRISYADAAQQLGAVLARPVSYQTLSADEQRAAMVAAGMPPALAEADTQALELFAHGDSDWITEDVPNLLGRPARTFREFVADHTDAFASSVDHTTQDRKATP
jgi:uncharacterized protein YbjT (DUF2867 family)